MDQRLTAILPCNDLDATEVFFGRLGFVRDAAGPAIIGCYRTDMAVSSTSTMPSQAG